MCECEWGFYALSASKAIFRARTYNCIYNLVSPVMITGFGLVLVYWGLTPQQQPGSYQGGEMMMNSVFLVEETGVPGGNHRPTASDDYLMNETIGGNRPPGDNPLLFSISGTGSFICPVA